MVAFLAPHTHRAVLIATCLLISAACGDSSGPDEPDALIIAGGQNAAFAGDTISLSTFFLNSLGSPLGIPPDDVQWGSSDTSVLRRLRDSVFVALSPGTSLISAEVTVNGATLRTAVPWTVIASPDWHVAWLRQSNLGEPMRLITMSLVDRRAVSGPQFGHPRAGQALPAVSPDGRYVAIQATRPVSDAAPSAIYVVELATNTVVALTDSMPGNQIAPRWTPDGSVVLFSSDAGGGWDIWSIPRSGGNPARRVALQAAAPIFFDVSKTDGRLIAALSTPERGNDLWELSLDTGQVRRITNTPAVPKSTPRVSPDGLTIVYTGPLDDSQESVAFVIPRFGGAPHELLPRVRVPGFRATETPTWVAHSTADAWTRDGAYILVMWRVNGTRFAGSASSPDSWFYAGDIYAVSPDGQLRLRLTSWPWGDAQADHY